VSAAELERAFREEWGAVVATLARRLGDLQAAEDAAAEAFAAAAVAWARDGAPPSPGGWLTVTAWRKAVDAHRRAGPVAVDPHVLGEVAPEAEEAAVDVQALAPGSLGDDRLGLIFACCHPALALEVRVAMTLRYVAGLTTREIAAAFLVPEATLAQRLVRAKRKIKDAGIRFELPARPAERLTSVRTVVYLVFNEGFAATSGDELIRPDLCEEAIWLGRLLHRLLPADAETAGLLALMLLHHSRAAARQAGGKPVPLDEQDRASWDRALIDEGTRVLDAALDRREPGSYQLQAAIAALHAQAARFEDTDWPQIALLYGALARLDRSPVVEVNRAVAVGMADGPLAGLAVLEPVLASGALEGYSPLHAAHAALLEKAGYSERARGAWARAAETSANPALREELLRRHENL
jgi:RNA polymerase sigma-70 factor, ECF subfamily